MLPLILTALLHADLINVDYLTYVSLLGHAEVAFFKWRRQWRWIDTKIYNYIIIASLKSETMG